MTITRTDRTDGPTSAPIACQTGASLNSRSLCIESPPFKRTHDDFVNMCCFFICLSVYWGKRCGAIGNRAAAVDLCDTKCLTVAKRSKNMKTDPRTRYTRQIITSAFWQLLRQKSMEKITV